MNDKTQARLRRARKSRVRMRTAGDVRLSVNRTPRHIYAQIINGDGDRVLAGLDLGQGPSFRRYRKHGSGSGCW